jgi:hypothetical protein
VKRQTRMEDKEMKAKTTLRFAASLMAVLVALSATMTAHAAESSTPVKVTNSDNNPVVTQDVGQRASQMVHLKCLMGEGVPVSVCYDAFTFANAIPANQNLVITAVDLADSGCTALTYVGLSVTEIVNGDESINWVSSWQVTGNSPTLHFTYPPGFAIPANSHGLTISLGLGGPLNSCQVQGDIYGYLTAN